ncbi:MAG: hypothetical protein V7784_19385, partial [Oceanospirillaceae bacterium]
WYPSYLSLRSKHAKSLYLNIMFFDDRDERYIYFYDLMARLGIKEKARSNQRRIANNAFKALLRQGLIEYFEYKNSKATANKYRPSNNNYRYVYCLTNVSFQKSHYSLDEDVKSALEGFL